MGTVLASTIVNDAAVILQDISAVRWPAAELLRWLNEGMIAAVGYKPSAYTLNKPVQLVPGTLQRLPADAIQLVDVPRNLGAAGTKPGRAIRIIDRDILDTQVPDWHSRAAKPEIQHYAYAIADPETFYVYPQASGGQFVQLVYSAKPPPVTLAEPIPMSDIYEPALLNYVLYRALLKEAESGDLSRASSYLNACVGILTGRAQAEMAKNPNKDPDGNPLSRTPRK